MNCYKSSDDIVTRRVGTIYDASATCPRFRQFLAEIFFPDARVIEFVQRCMGYTLQGGVQEQCLFICVGSGKNGKSTLLQVLTKLLGSYAGALPMSSLMQTKYNNQTYDIATLPGKRFISCSEGEVGEKLAEAKVKSLTGGDQISARQIYQEQMIFTPTHKLWLATNELPSIDGAGEGIWRRLQNVIRFPVTIADAKVDHDLGHKLAAELPGILNFAVKGFHEWKRIGLSAPEAVRREYLSYRHECDSVGNFLDACCENKAKERERASELYRRYESFSNDNDANPLTRTMFGKVLGLKGYIPKRTADGNMWQGLKLRCEPVRREVLWSAIGPNNSCDTNWLNELG